MANGFQRRPLLSRPIILAPFTIAGYFAGSFLTKRNYEKNLAREIYIQDYIRLHPEDFPEADPKKYKDILVDWHPIRH